MSTPDVGCVPGSCKIWHGFIACYDGDDHVPVLQDVCLPLCEHTGPWKRRKTTYDVGKFGNKDCNDEFENALQRLPTIPFW
eukprot:6191359-Karenia_brevis.AAC.1